MVLLDACQEVGLDRQLPIRVNLSGRGAPDGEDARPRAPGRRSQSQQCIFRP